MSKSMTEALPTIVLIPGAWHSPIHYQLLTDLLQKAGYRIISSALPSLDPLNPEVTVTDDAIFIKDKLLAPLLTEGKEIILVAHSYGGSPAGVAAKGLSVVERKERGEEGGIIGMVFIAALLAQKGASLKGMMGGKLGSWVNIDSPREGYLTTSTPIDIFYHDVDPLKAEEAIKQLKPQATAALSTSTETDAAWADGGFEDRRAYIVTTQDRGMPTFAQEGMLAGTGVEWDVRRFDTSHSPFLSQPEKLAEVIVELAEKWSEPS